MSGVEVRGPGRHWGEIEVTCLLNKVVGIIIVAHKQKQGRGKYTRVKSSASVCIGI